MEPWLVLYAACSCPCPYQVPSSLEALIYTLHACNHTIVILLRAGTTRLLYNLSILCEPPHLCALVQGYLAGILPLNGTSPPKG